MLPLVLLLEPVSVPALVPVLVLLTPGSKLVLDPQPEAEPE